LSKLGSTYFFLIALGYLVALNSPAM